jgi:hypothetical protein
VKLIASSGAMVKYMHGVYLRAPCFITWYLGQGQLGFHWISILNKRTGIHGDLWCFLIICISQNIGTLCVVNNSARADITRV